jgi:hypothetical protein
MMKHDSAMAMAVPWARALAALDRPRDPHRDWPVRADRPAGPERAESFTLNVVRNAAWINPFLQKLRFPSLRPC